MQTQKMKSNKKNIYYLKTITLILKTTNIRDFSCILQGSSLIYNK